MIGESYGCRAGSLLDWSLYGMTSVGRHGADHPSLLHCGKIYRPLFEESKTINHLLNAHNNDPILRVP